MNTEIYKLKYFRTIATVVLTAVLCLGVSAQAEILYADNFDGPEGVDLDGYTPDVRTGTYGTSATASWAAGVQYNANGVMWSAPNSGHTARLAFTPVAGEIYELSADFEGLSTYAGQMDDWISLGFFAGSTKYAWMNISSQLSADGREVKYYSGDGVISGTVPTTVGERNLKIVLDTSDTNWTVAWYLDDVQAGSTYTYATNPSITEVGFGRADNARSTFDNFQLAVIPEPASVLLLFLALPLLVVCRRSVR
ncbi:PEP-CTERM sorting domain-containing protein [Kiritimatiellota bacterium B12222]|nr:PEP-CTERM sorting domain-containing protein [Kiritimatiellota bacterium B12222]